MQNVAAALIIAASIMVSTYVHIIAVRPYSDSDSLQFPTRIGLLVLAGVAILIAIKLLFFPKQK